MKQHEFRERVVTTTEIEMLEKDKDAACELIDQLERHKAALLGDSLKIGRRTIAKDYSDTIRMLNYLRTMIEEQDSLIAKLRASR